MIIQIKQKQELENLKNKHDVILLMFYTDTSETSLKAKQRVIQASDDFKEMPVALVNASRVKDIHPLYEVNSVPTVLVLKQGKAIKTVQGLQSKEHYELLFYDAPRSGDEGSKVFQHHVVVYSAPSCSWCNRLKQYLRKNRIRFNDIDISRDQHAAQELMERTGQTGVPQTEIDGHWVVGFDQPRIDNLLGLKR